MVYSHTTRIIGSTIIKMRRFYEVLGSAATSLVFWLLALLVLSVTEMRSDAFKANPFVSYSFFVLQLPLYTLVMFGSYSLCSIGYYLMALGKFFKSNYFRGLRCCSC